MRAITTSKGQEDFSSLVNIAKKELKYHWEIGLSENVEVGVGVGGGLDVGVGGGGGIGTGGVQNDNKKDSFNSSSERRKSEIITKIDRESKPANCKNMNQIETKLEIPSKWTVFRDPDANKEDFKPLHEILRRHGGRDLVMVADIIEGVYLSLLLLFSYPEQCHS